MYSLAIYIYMFCVNIAALFGNKKARLLIKGHRNTWNILRQNIQEDEHPIWFHAASLGEFEQGRPLIERLRHEHPEEKILLTFFSPSGYEVRKDYEYADVICYLPFDTMLNARKFMRLAHPKMAFFIKYEFWADYLYILHHHKIPVFSVSSIFRPQQIFFRWYCLGYGIVLKFITHYFVQNEESRQLLKSKGVTNVSVVGDTRFARVKQIKEEAKNLPVIEAFIAAPERKTFIVGSSWEADEDVYLPYFEKNNCQLIIAPHVVSEERMEKLTRRLEDMGKKVVRYSQTVQQINLATLQEADVMLIDCYGLLSSIYRYADIAYVGGGFGVGIHNVPEAAVYGVPVIIGPNNKKFREAQALLQNGGCKEICSAEEFRETMNLLLNNEVARKEAGRVAAQYIEDNAEAANLVYAATIGKMKG